MITITALKVIFSFECTQLDSVQANLERVRQMIKKWANADELTSHQNFVGRDKKSSSNRVKTASVDNTMMDGSHQMFRTTHA